MSGLWRGSTQEPWCRPASTSARSADLVAASADTRACSTAARATRCATWCSGQQSISYQTWVDCMNRCYASGGY